MPRGKRSGSSSRRPRKKTGQDGPPPEAIAPPTEDPTPQRHDPDDDDPLARAARELMDAVESEGVVLMPGESGPEPERPPATTPSRPAFDAELDAPPRPLDTLLANAHAAVLQREERRVGDRRHGNRRDSARINPIWLAAASLAWVGVALALLAPPAFLRPPDNQPFMPGPELREASARYGLWLARHRVEDFLTRAGRLPSMLDESGMHDSAIQFDVTGERTYTLLTPVGERIFRLTDRMAADSFLGRSLETLRQAD